MRISDPNKLIGRVMEIKAGEELAEVIIDVGDLPVTATITSGAASDLNLNKGDAVFALFKSTDGTIIKDTNK